MLLLLLLLYLYLKKTAEMIFNSSLIGGQMISTWSHAPCFCIVSIRQCFAFIGYHCIYDALNNVNFCYNNIHDIHVILILLNITLYFIVVKIKLCQCQFQCQCQYKTDLYLCHLSHNNHDGYNIRHEVCNKISLL